MTALTNINYQDQIALITINNPPVNALSVEVRKSLLDSLHHLNVNSSVKAIVIKGSNKTFPAGADIKEFGQPPQKPELPEINNFIENINKPVICAMHGNALGGGLEIALACHYRIAESETKLGLPEVHLGLIPGAGGTQRLPRIIGIPEAYIMMANGLPIDAKKGFKLGLIDKVIDNIDLDPINFAKDLIVNKKTNRRTKDRSELITNLEESKSVISEIRNNLKKTHRGQLAPLKLGDCLNKLLYASFDESLKFERHILKKSRPALRLTARICHWMRADPTL